MAKNKKKTVQVQERKDKISSEHLQELLEVVNKINSLQFNIGRLESQKHKVLHELALGNDTVSMMQDKMKNNIIRKITIGKDYKNDSMHYAVGQEVYGGHRICDIIEEEDKYCIYIKKEEIVIPWKDFNKNMAISIEYNLEY